MGRRRRKRRNKCAVDTTEAKKNCRTTSKTAPFTVDCHLLIVLLKQIFCFHSFLEMSFEIEKYFNFIHKRCLSSYQLSKFYRCDAGVNWNPLDLETKQKIVFFLYHLTLQLHVSHGLFQNSIKMKNSA